MSAIFKKEIKSYFTSLSTYIYFALYFLMTGVYFVRYCLEGAGTQFGYYVLSKSFIVIVLFVPLCTMRMLAMEKKERTDQLLFTAPVSFLWVLSGKYLATVCVVLLPILCSVIYPVVISEYGELDGGFLMTSYIACLLEALVLISLGMFLSAVVSGTVLAAVVSYAVYGVILLLRVIESVLSSDAIYQGIHKISVYNKYHDMVSGILRSGDIIYMLAVAAVFFVSAWIALAARKEGRKNTVIKMLAVWCGFVLLSVMGMCNTIVYDFTTEKILSLSEETTRVVKAVEKPTQIYYMGLKSRANATYQEFLKKYEDLNDNIEVIYLDVEKDAAFQDEYLSSVDTIRETSLLVMAGDRNIYLDSADYTQTIQTSAYSYKSLLDIESQLTSAINYVNSEDLLRAVWLTGNGEETIPQSFSSMLQMNNYYFRSENLEERTAAIESTFSDDCRLVVINAPQTDYSDGALEQLRVFLKSGGSLLVTLDALNEDLPKLYAFLAEYGFGIQSGVVIENNAGNYAYDTPYYIVPSINQTDYSEYLIKNNMRVFTMTSKGIKLIDPADGYTVTEVLKTNADSYSKVADFDNYTVKSEEDISGPFTIAAAAQKEGEGSIFVVASNLMINEEVDTDSNGANKRFLLNVLNSLTENKNGIMIDSKEVGTQTAFYPTSTRGFVKLMTIAVIPVVLFAIGILAVLARYYNIMLRLQRRRKEHERKNMEQI